MDAKEVKDLMSRLAAGVGQRAIALQCDCENLETVYIMIDEGGDALVTDDHRTFQYLARGTDSAYMPLQKLDITAARRICEELGVELKPAPPEGYPSIECVVGPRQPISEVVERVAEAVDRIFHLGSRRELK